MDLELNHRSPPSGGPRRFPFGLLILSVIVTLNLAAMSVSVTPSVESPVPLGTLITFVPAVSGAASGTLSYAFRARPANGAFRTVVDFGPKASLDWTTIQSEGDYEVEVLVKNSATGEIASGSTQITFQSLVSGDVPVVTPSANPLVFIYSAPPCAAASRMRVAFRSADGSVAQQTRWRACSPAHTTNFYLAGFRATTLYTAVHSIDSGTAIASGPEVGLFTPAVSITLPPVAMVTPPVTPDVDGILLQSMVNSGAIATDLWGNLLWYSPMDISYVTRPQAGGTFLAISEDQTQDPAHQSFREFDLAGITMAETNAARVSEQLAAMGMHPINSFHHEARKLANGEYLVLAASERILTDVQGPGDVDVIGDTILVLNENLQVVWAWDSFDHLDTSRMAVLGETCSVPNPGCPPWYLAPVANDWLHGNSLQLTPDGDILYSSRHQDWIIKIDYQNGTGTGAVVWRLGQDGDFQIDSSDPSPWFSHQHDANFAANNKLLTLFDDGNTRNESDPSAHSRGQALSVDEENRVARLMVNADLGSYSSAVGSAQRLPNGNYHFDLGFIMDAGGNLTSQSVEVNADGTIVYAIQFGALEYRSFRMRDLYTEP